MAGAWKMLPYPCSCFLVALSIFKGLETMRGSWSSGLHMATVVHKLHPPNLSWLLLGLIPELPSGHSQGQILSGVNQEHPGVLPERHLVQEGGTANGLPKWF